MSVKMDDGLTNVVKIDFKSRSTLASFSEVLPEIQEESDKKHALFAKWLELGTVCVLFDARSLDAKVPKEFEKRGDLRLNFCYEFHVPDFGFNERGVWSTLTFDSGHFFCVVPWTSVYGLQSAKLNQGAVWFESFPKDYDQVEVLGFSEKMCDITLAKQITDQELVPKNNVVEVDFSHRDDNQ